MIHRRDIVERLHNEMRKGACMLFSDESLNFICPVCEAAPGERCHVNVRVVCFQSHEERRELAAVAETETQELQDVNAWPRRWQAS